MKIAVPVLAVLILLSSCNSQFGKVLKSKDNEYKYKMAEQYYAQKKWDKASQLFEGLFPYVKGTPRFEDMYYKYAYCAYNQKDYLNAENLFKNYLESFPNSQRAEEVEFMRAYCFYKQSPKVDLDQTSTGKATALLQAFINTHQGSERNKEAAALIEQLHGKQEAKELKAAQLYYSLGYYKAAAVAFGTLMDDYPESDKSDVYKLEVIKAYYKYAQMSIPEKQQDRYRQVLTEVTDFEDRFPQSNLLAQAQDYRTQSTNNIKRIQDEQAKATTGQ